MKISLYFSGIASHNPLNINATNDFFYGNEGYVVVNNFFLLFMLDNSGLWHCKGIDELMSIKLVYEVSWMLW